MSATRGAVLVTGPVRTHLLRLSLPMVWALAAMMGFHLVDTWFVAQLGAGELAAMGYSFPVVNMLVSIGIGMMAGTSSVLARALGEGDESRVKRLCTDALSLATVVSVLLALAGILSIDALFSRLGATGESLELVRRYMTVWYAGLPFVLVPMAGMGAIRATGDTRLQSRIMIGAALFNLVLDPLLIFGLAGLPRLEMEGAALATVLARIATLVVTLRVLNARLHLLETWWPGRHALLASWRAVLHVGLPAAGSNVIVPLSTAAIVAMVAAYGDPAVAGFGAAMRIEAVSLVPFYALSAIIGPFAGQNLGARRPDRIDEAMRSAAAFCLLAGLALAAALALAAQPLAALFSDLPAVREVTVLFLWLVPLGYGAAGVVMLVNAALNGLGRPIPGAVISLGRALVLQVPAAWLGGRLAGVTGVAVGMMLASLVSGALAWIWFQRLQRDLR